MEGPIIAPSILAADFSDLRGEITRAVDGGADWIHLDVMDGAFVPNITIGPPVIAALRKLTSLPFDTHLMIEDPDRYLEEFRRAGADIITVHVEACRHLHRTIQRIKELGARAGVSLNPATPVGAVQEILEEVDLILVMSVNPGFGGQSFIPGSVERIRALRAMTSHLERAPIIEVDGGIDERTVGMVSRAGARALVAGTYVFGSDDVAAAIRSLREQAAAEGGWAVS